MTVKQGSIEAAWTGAAQCEGCGIRELALFADLQLNDFNLIHLPIEEVRLEPGDALYQAEDPAQALFTLRSGLIKLMRYLPDGQHRIVRLLRPGDTIGMEALVSQQYEHSAVALQPALTCRIPVKVVERLSTETPRLHRQLMDRWHRSVREADDRLTGLSTGGAKARIARLVLSLPEEDGGTRPGVRRLFGREDMGAMLGVTTETASRMIAELRRAGALTEMGDHLVACDDRMLRQLAGEEGTE